VKAAPTGAGDKAAAEYIKAERAKAATGTRAPTGAGDKAAAEYIKAEKAAIAAKTAAAAASEAGAYTRPLFSST
jgi:hypothetical protein